MSRYRWVLVNVVLGALVIGALPGLVAAGNGVGAAFNLGVKNTVTAVTKLVATTSNPALLVQNAGTGPGLQITVGTGKAPITVSAGAGKATNLNADLIDGKDSSALQNKITQLSDLNGIGCGSSKLLLATSALRCVGDSGEPNDAQGAAQHIGPIGTAFGALVGGGDVDWYFLDNPTCGTPPGHPSDACVVNLSLDSVNVTMDVYFGATLMASSVKTYGGHFDDYSGAPPDYTVRVYSTNREPYTISYSGG